MVEFVLFVFAVLLIEVIGSLIKSDYFSTLFKMFAYLALLLTLTCVAIAQPPALSVFGLFDVNLR
jgi:hypothetical protein